MLFIMVTDPKYYNTTSENKHSCRFVCVLLQNCECKLLQQEVYQFINQFIRQNIIKEEEEAVLPCIITPQISK